MFPFYDAAWRRVINLTGTAIRASEDEPVLLGGIQLMVEGSAWFVATSVMDLAALPEFDKDKLQVPLHDDDARNFRLEELVMQQVITDYDHPSKVFNTKKVGVLKEDMPGTISIDTSEC